LPHEELSQAEADELLGLEKHRASEDEYAFPAPGSSLSVPLVSADHREEFLLDVARGRIDLQKVTYQNRARNIVVLARLDLGGRPHRNPDGTEVPTPHLHLYREGHGDKVAVAVPAEAFPSLGDLWATLHHFMSYCHITRKPKFVRELFP
jgi:hypothetical protein